MADDKTNAAGKRRIILNAFDMFTPSHLSFGQWRRDDDRSKTKRRDLSYWTDLAEILERGDINALVIADTFGQHDVYKGGAETTLRLSVQYPMGDPAIVCMTAWDSRRNIERLMIPGSRSLPWQQRRRTWGS
jgi:hypothetical protein